MSGIKWRILTILGIGWLLFTIIYACNYVAVPVTSNRAFETAKFVFLSISCFGVIFSALLTSFNSLEASQNIDDKIRFDRTENSFNYMKRWDLDMLPYRDEFRKIAKVKATLSEAQIHHLMATDPNVERAVVNLFNFFEEIFLSIKADRVDEPLLRNAFCLLFTNTCEWFLTANEKISNASTMQNIKELKDRWK